MIMTINNTSSTNPSHLNTYANRIEIIIINANTVNARLRCPGIEDHHHFVLDVRVYLFLKALKSISKPLKNIKKIKPNVDKIFRIESFLLYLEMNFQSQSPSKFLQQLARN